MDYILYIRLINKTQLMGNHKVGENLLAGTRNNYLTQSYFLNNV